MLKRLVSRVRELALRERLDRESREELLQHLELRAAELERRGHSPAEARRRARIELGSAEEARERLRDARSGAWLDALTRDAGYALRQLRKRPGFTTACLVTIALGVGASTALFAVVNGVVLRPLPLPDPGSLVRVYDTNLAKGVERTGITSGNLVDWRRRARGFRGIAGHYTMGRTLTLGGDSEVVLSAQVTEDFFPLLGIGAALGRTFTAEETRAALFNSAAAPVSADPVVVLGHALWQRRFGGDPAVVGRTLLVERLPMRVVGVMPESFTLLGPEVQLYLPWGIRESSPRDQHYVVGLARLGPGVTRAQAEAELRGVAAVLGDEHPLTNEGWSVRLAPLHDEVVGDARTTLLVLWLAVALVLVVACANVGLLSLARSLERLPEAALRQALGAPRPRLLRQFLLEPLLISAAGGTLGLGLAALGLPALKQGAVGLPRLHEAALDPLAVAFAALATLAAALVSGLPPALRLARADAAPDLAGAPGRIVGGGRGSHALRDGLVVAQVAVAVVLLAGAGLLLRSYQRLQAVDPGFDPRGVLVAPVFLDMERYGGGDKSRLYYATLLERLRALPGVQAAGAATALPASPLGPDFERPVWPEGAPADEHGLRSAWVRMVTDDYFRTLGMRVVAGRPFDRRDAPHAPRTVMLSQSLARRLYPKGDAVGRRLIVDYSTGSNPYQVVGLVADVRFSGPRAEPRHEIYLPHAQRPYLVMNVAVRGPGDPRLLAPAVRGVLHQLDPGKPAHGLYDLDELLGNTYARDRYLTLLLSGFAGVAVLLALAGVHGVLSHRVRERRREIGIRQAVGATETELVGWIASQGLRLVLLGLLVGAALGVALARFLAGVLYGTSPLDPAALVAAAALPLLALLVSLHPAWRAAHIPAAEVLRSG